jgi:hypothetical protein
MISASFRCRGGKKIVRPARRVLVACCVLVTRCVLPARVLVVRVLVVRVRLARVLGARCVAMIRLTSSDSSRYSCHRTSAPDARSSVITVGTTDIPGPRT